MQPEFDWRQTLKHLCSTHETAKIFDAFIAQMEQHFGQPARNISEMRAKQNMSIRGRIWEQFCAAWLWASGNYSAVWLWNEVPEEVRVACRLLTHRDNGIDIIAYNASGYVAIQCKYRKAKNSVTWTCLSTFIGLCSSTGPWHQHIVMTNCGSVSRPVQKGPKDRSICAQTFRSSPRETWLKMVGLYNPHQIEILPQLAPPLIIEPEYPNKEQLRELRLRHFVST